ncbi:hypothetical protein BDR05DRAFT_978211 [Suillus weaverae]|nr:hypothetical protein BDR05DRAFT_978211 [Suillus weaverae]
MYIENVRGQEEIYRLDNAGFQATGASVTIVLNHTIRRHRPGEDDATARRNRPVPVVHVDQTMTRFQIINLWRPISHAAVDCPFALYNYRSVDEKIDLVPLAHIYPNREGNSQPRESYVLKYNPNHQWKYMRAITPEEFVLFKCFDSVQDGSVAIFSPHTTFQDPNAEEGAPPRESIEMRFLVFYD